MSGLTPTGFEKKTLQDIMDEVSASLRATISPSLNLLSTSVFGQLNGIFADKVRELWDLGEALYRAMYPDSASGDALDGVAAMTGAVRLTSTKSTVTLDHIFLDSGATVPAGSVVSVGEDGERFVTLTDVTNSLGYEATFSVDAESEEYGSRVGLATTIDEIKTPVTGWSDKAALTCANAENYVFSGGPKTLTVKIDRGSVQTISIPDATYTASQMATLLDAALPGVMESVAVGTKVRINSVTSGTGSSVEVTGGTGNSILGFTTTEVKGFNSLDAELGREEETDIEFRERRTSLLFLAGTGPVDAIRAEVIAVADVTQCTVLENDTDATDGNGLPPHSVEALVLGGDDQDVAEAIFRSKAAGIATYGSTSKTVVDSMGYSHTIKFSRPTDIDIYFDLTVLTNSDFPATGADLIKEALVTEGADLMVGDDVIALRFKAVPLSITGVIDVTVFKLGIAPSPSGTTNLTMGVRDLAVFDTSRIAVTVT